MKAFSLWWNPSLKKKWSLWRNNLQCWEIKTPPWQEKKSSTHALELDQLVTQFCKNVPAVSWCPPFHVHGAPSIHNPWTISLDSILRWFSPFLGFLCRVAWFVISRWRSSCLLYKNLYDVSILHIQGFHRVFILYPRAIEHESGAFTLNTTLLAVSVHQFFKVGCSSNIELDFTTIYSFYTQVDTFRFWFIVIFANHFALEVMRDSRSGWTPSFASECSRRVSKQTNSFFGFWVFN